MKQKRPHSLSTPLARLHAWLHFYLKDHHLLRMGWWNLSEIAPGVWRCNQPSPYRLARLKARGLRHVVSLRGAVPHSYNLLEERACARLGLPLEYLSGITARELKPAATLLSVVDALAQIDGPVVFHCKSGADRTGIVAALYLILIKGADVAQTAEAQLAPRWVHFRRSKAGVLDHLFRVYLRDGAPAGQGLRDWLETEYDPKRIEADFKDWRAGAGRWAT